MRLRSVQRSVQRGPVHGLFGRETFPGGAILHWDADIDAFSEQTGGAHTFNHAVLSPQYQRNADGSYANVGAKPAVDTVDGEKWLRSCGAVTNLLPSGAEDFSGTSWYKSNLVAPTLVNGRWKLVSANGVNGQAYRSIAPSGAGTYNFSVAAKAGEFRYLRISIGIGFIAPRVSSLYVDLLNGVVATGVETGSALVSIAPGADGEWIISFPCTYSGSEDTNIYLFPRNVVNDSILSGDGVSGIYLRNPQLTATAYPVPYVPPGVTQPASNATTTNGSWFALPDGSPLWQALDGQADGVELVTNDILKSTTGWTTRNCTLSAGSNGLAVTSTGSGSYGVVTRNVTTVVGRRYEMLVRVKSLVSMSALAVIGVWIGSATWSTASLAGAIGSVFYLRHQFTAVSTSTEIRLGCSNVVGASALFESISIQRIQPQPLTLATRVRMGVGSGDIAANTALEGISCADSGGTVMRAQDISGAKYPASSNDGTTSALSPAITWSRNAVMRRFVQVNMAGTQFRVGYMIEGTHTTIQWGSLVAYDGSFGPSTLYKLLLNFNNPTPKWFNKITVWRKQVSDAEILEAMA